MKSYSDHVMFLTVTNIQSGEAVQLQQCIDNLGGNLRISLRTLTYIVGWHNVEAGQTIS